jgi:hypothetical protein
MAQGRQRYNSTCRRSQKHPNALQCALLQRCSTHAVLRQMVRQPRPVLFRVMFFQFLLCFSSLTCFSMPLQDIGSRSAPTAVTFLLWPPQGAPLRVRASAWNAAVPYDRAGPGFICPRYAQERTAAQSTLPLRRLSIHSPISSRCPCLRPLPVPCSALLERMQQSPAGPRLQH